MATLVVPPLDAVPWPTLGPQLEQFLKERAIFGPGSLRGQPAQLDPEKRAVLYRSYEVYPQGHQWAGRRRFPRVGISWRKGTAKTEFAAWIGYAELHPEGPVRCDGFDASGRPVGRPVRDPYIPMVAYTEEQTEELAFGALYVVVSEGPDADIFDAGLDRILRLDQYGREAGKAVPLAGSPNAADGARTTFQHFDETHRQHLPRLVAAHETMLGNIPKRPLEDPWSLETTTSGQPGQGSVAEKTHYEAESIGRGEIDDPDLFYFHREAGPGYDLRKYDDRIAAITEATGPIGEYGPGQFRSIAKQWDRPGADKAYLERVWLNRWTQSEAQAFDVARWKDLRSEQDLEPGEFVTGGFDGARFRDATAFVITSIATGRQKLWGLWERPLNAGDDWEVPEDEVTASLADMMSRFDVWKIYADPPHWTETVGSWESKHPDQVEEWWTNRPKAMALALRSYNEAIASRSVSWVDDDLAEAFTRHIGNAGRRETNLWDEDKIRLFLLAKIHQDRKFDAAMAGCLSWICRLDAIKSNAKPRPKRTAPRRIR